MVTGPFSAGLVFVAVTPCDADNAPATCPAPGFPPNYLGALNPWTGHISRVPVTGPSLEPQGMIFIGRAGLQAVTGSAVMDPARGRGERSPGAAPAQLDQLRGDRDRGLLGRARAQVEPDRRAQPG